MNRFVLPLALLPLVAVGGWLAPRLSPQTPVEIVEVDSMAPTGPCMRWGGLECCYVDEGEREGESLIIDY